MKLKVFFLLFFFFISASAQWFNLNSGISENLVYAQFIDPSNGWVNGGLQKAYKTTDGGNSWTFMQSASTLIGPYFLNQNQGPTQAFPQILFNGGLEAIVLQILKGVSNGN